MLIKEFKKFINAILFWLCLVGIFSTFFFLPLFAGQSASVITFQKFKSDILPQGVELIVTSPLSGFLSQVIISIALSFIVLFPFFVYALITYLSPALREKERRAITWVIVPSVLLFFSGCIFAYLYIIPSTFKLLYPFAASLGAASFFLVNEFIHLIFGMMIATGVLFLLPVFMTLLSSLGLVSSRFWVENWRYAIFSLLLFSAIITPDGTGITMLLLSLPLAGLYAAGCTVTLRQKRVYQSNK